MCAFLNVNCTTKKCHKMKKFQNVKVFETFFQCYVMTFSTLSISTETSRFRCCTVLCSCILSGGVHIIYDHNEIFMNSASGDGGSRYIIHISGEEGGGGRGVEDAVVSEPVSTWTSSLAHRQTKGNSAKSVLICEKCNFLHFSVGTLHRLWTFLKSESSFFRTCSSKSSLR